MSDQKVDVQEFQTDAAAWLASARVAANSPDPDRPIELEVVRRRSRAQASPLPPHALVEKLGPVTWVLLASSESEADEARAILRRFQLEPHEEKLSPWQDDRDDRCDVCHKPRPCGDHPQTAREATDAEVLRVAEVERADREYFDPSGEPQDELVDEREDQLVELELHDEGKHDEESVPSCPRCQELYDEDEPDADHVCTGPHAPEQKPRYLTPQLLKQHVPSMTDLDEDLILSRIYGDDGFLADLAKRTCSCGEHIEGFYAYVDHLMSLMGEESHPIHQEA